MPGIKLFLDFSSFCVILKACLKQFLILIKYCTYYINVIKYIKILCAGCAFYGAGCVGGLVLVKEIDGISVNYEVKGSGDLLFILHGWGANIGVYNSVSDLLSQKFTVITLDFPGFGGTPEPPEVWSVSDYADFTVKFISSFGAQNVILFGHSFGGRVIIKMASLSNLPFHISKIIFADSAGVMPVRSNKQNFRTRIYKIGKFFLSLYPVRKLFPNALEALCKKFSSADYAAASPLMRGVLVKTVNEDLTPLLKNIKCQTLLIWGANDTATPISDAHIFEREISSSGADVGLCEIKNAGHYSFLDQPYVFQNILKSFFKIGE